MAAPVLVVSGCSAVGKSTISRLLAGSFISGVHLPIEVLLRLFDEPFPDPATPEGARRYEAVGAAAASAAVQLALAEYSVILDGPIFPDGAKGTAEICGRRGVSVHYVVLRADLATCLARAARRAPPGPPRLDEFRALHGRFADLGGAESYVIDASGTAEQIASSVLSDFNSGRLLLRPTTAHPSASH